MKYFLGIDAGTSGIKALVLDETGRVCGSGYRECDLITPRFGWVEQDPREWWIACSIAVKEAVKKCGHGKEIEGIGLSGQMQGITPVSYTHLDVYKRQVQPIAIGKGRRNGTKLSL